MATPTTDLRYRIEGGPDNPVLVLSHAMGASMAMWEPQVERLSRAFRVLRYDHRGHGGSPVPAGPYTIGDIGGDVQAAPQRHRQRAEAALAGAGFAAADAVGAEARLALVGALAGLAQPAFAAASARSWRSSRVSRWRTRSRSRSPPST